jgi:hypothetical protein
MEHMDIGGMQMVNNDEFEQLLRNMNKVQEVDHRICVDCNLALIVSGSELSCPSCGMVTTKGESGMDTTAATGTIKIANSRGRYYNFSGDYSRTQRKVIEDQLNKNNNAINENKLPKNIITNVAAIYNTIQQMIVMCGGQEKKFVRRGNIKDEVLAAIIYYECIRSGVARQTKDIAEFMKLPVNGFSRGDDILRTIHRQKKLELPIDASNDELCANRYLESLGIMTPEYKTFIMDVVDVSERSYICMHSAISSKIVGTIWMLVSQLGLDVTIEKLENTADKIKKNTFMKFYVAVQHDPITFADIFRKHKIKPLYYGARPKYQ